MSEYAPTHRTMIFDTLNEAESFRRFLEFKSVKIAVRNNEPPNHVTAFDPMTDQQWFMLLYKFGRWM